MKNVKVNFGHNGDDFIKDMFTILVDYGRPSDFHVFFKTRREKKNDNVMSEIVNELRYLADKIEKNEFELNDGI